MSQVLTKRPGKSFPIYSSTALADESLPDLSGLADILCQKFRLMGKRGRSAGVVEVSDGDDDVIAVSPTDHKNRQQGDERRILNFDGDLEMRNAAQEGDDMNSRYRSTDDGSESVEIEEALDSEDSMIQRPEENSVADETQQDIDEGSCSPPPAKRLKSDYEALVEQHRIQLSNALESASIFLRTLDQITHEAKSVSKLIPNNLPQTSAISPQFQELSEKEVSSFPILVSRIRRHARVLSTFGENSISLIDRLKSKYQQSRESLLAAHVELDLLSNRIQKQFTETPKLQKLLPYLYPKDEYEASRKAADPDGKKLPGFSVEQIAEKLHSYAVSESRMESGSGSENFEKYLLNWLRFDLACRERDASAVESVRLRREGEEEKLKVFKKREAEFVLKVSPIEKDLQQKIAATASTASRPLSSSESVTVSPSFPLEAFSLPSPLFRLYSSLFSYKAINADGGLNIKIIKVTDSKIPPNNASFHPHNLRLQLSIDKSFEKLPPNTFAKAAGLFPLNVRFTYIPQLQLVTTLCQFPRFIANDSTFLGDLFFPNDDGMTSPHPLHHAIYDLEGLQSTNEEIPNPTPDPASSRAPHEDVFVVPTAVPITPILQSDKAARPSSDETMEAQSSSSMQMFSIALPPPAHDQPSAARTIAQKLIQFEFGRPYRWAQSLAGITYSVTDPADQSFKDLLPPSSVPINAKRFVQLFRARATLRSWTLYIEESLKPLPFVSLRDKPTLIPPPNVHLPSTLGSASATASNSIQSVTPSNAREFLDAGGNPNGNAATAQYRDVHFLNIQLKISGVCFTALIALPLDAREAEFCIQLKSLPTPASLKGTSLSLSQFSLVDFSMISSPSRSYVTSVIEKLNPTERKAVFDMLNNWDKLGLMDTKIVGWGNEGPKGDVRTNEGKQIRILLDLLPAGSTGLTTMPLLSGTNKETVQRLTHYCDPKLAAIQESINSAVPKSHGGRASNGPCSRSMMIIQLVILVV